MRDLNPLVVFSSDELSVMFGLDKSSIDLPCDDTPLWPLTIGDNDSRQLWGDTLPPEDILCREKNLSKYIERGYAFEPPADFEEVSACPNCGESVMGCEYCKVNN